MPQCLQGSRRPSQKKMATGQTRKERDDLDVTPSSSQPDPAKKSLMGEVPTHILSVAYHALAQVMEVLCEVSVGDSSRNGQFQRMKEGLDFPCKK